MGFFSNLKEAFDRSGELFALGKEDIQNGNAKEGIPKTILSVLSGIGNAVTLGGANALGNVFDENETVANTLQSIFNTQTEQVQQTEIPPMAMAIEADTTTHSIHSLASLLEEPESTTLAAYIKNGNLNDVTKLFESLTGKDFESEDGIKGIPAELDEARAYYNSLSNDTYTDSETFSAASDDFKNKMLNWIVSSGVGLQEVNLDIDGVPAVSNQLRNFIPGSIDLETPVWKDGEARPLNYVKNIYTNAESMSISEYISKCEADKNYEGLNKLVGAIAGDVESSTCVPDYVKKAMRELDSQISAENPNINVDTTKLAVGMSRWFDEMHLSNVSILVGDNATDIGISDSIRGMIPGSLTNQQYIDKLVESGVLNEDYKNPEVTQQAQPIEPIEPIELPKKFPTFPGTTLPRYNPEIFPDTDTPQISETLPNYNPKIFSGYGEARPVNFDTPSGGDSTIVGPAMITDEPGESKILPNVITDKHEGEIGYLADTADIPEDVSEDIADDISNDLEF